MATSAAASRPVLARRVTWPRRAVERGEFGPLGGAQGARAHLLGEEVDCDGGVGREDGRGEDTHVAHVHGEVEGVEEPVHGRSGGHEARVDGAADNAAQRVPRPVIEPVQEIVGAFRGQELGGAVVEVGIVLVDDLRRGRAAARAREGGWAARAGKLRTDSQRATEKSRIAKAMMQIKPRMKNLKIWEPLPSSSSRLCGCTSGRSLSGKKSEIVPSFGLRACAGACPAAVGRRDVCVRALLELMASQGLGGGCGGNLLFCVDAHTRNVGNCGRGKQCGAALLPSVWSVVCWRLEGGSERVLARGKRDTGTGGSALCDDSAEAYSTRC